MSDSRTSHFAVPLSGGKGLPVSGPEVEWDEATKRALTQRFRELDRAQAEAFISARNYMVTR